MTAPGVSYAPRPDSTPEAERGALAAIYRLILDTAERSEAVEPRQADDPKDARKDQNARTHSHFTE